MATPLGRLIIYTAKRAEMVNFYSRHFGFEEVPQHGDRITELVPRGGGCSLLLHAAAKGQRQGQSLVKLVFDVKDVPAFCKEAEGRGLVFGPVHRADGYQFANAKDPSGNSISVSGRAFVK